MTANRSTNFFARQQLARQSCRNQMILFVFAVMIIVVFTTLAVRFAWYLYLSTHAYTTFNAAEAQSYRQSLSAFTFFDPASFLFVAIAIIIVILAASLTKMTTLQKGGGAVAEMLGGRKISASTDNQAERRLINVVEEMAIASGIPVPQIYVLDQENNINAFAAGLELNDAAVAVTRGALDKLSRDELQGVIGHEFSHILNGDSRLNVQLIGILFGILFLGIAGRQIMSYGRLSARAGVAVIVMGFCLTVIGYIGTFLGRLMQCAVSRQKEFLADASAVQFTRNPLGLAGALKKIGGSDFGSNIQSPAARQASHLFFSESHPDELFPFLLNTHPPLVERIRLLDPAFDGKFITIPDDRQAPKPQYTLPYPGHLNIPAASMLPLVMAAEVINQVGNSTKEHLGQGQTWILSLPAEILKAAKTPQGAVCIIYALLLDYDAPQRELQNVAIARTLALQGNTDKVQGIWAQLSGLQQEFRLPLIELSMPALSGLTGMEKRNFLLILSSLINADGKITLFELTVQRLLTQYLSPSAALFGNITIFTLSPVGFDILVLLGALACAGHAGDKLKAENAFRAGVARIPELAARKPDFIYKDNCSYVHVNNALNHLVATSFKIRESVIDACAYCVSEDQTVTVEEGELLCVIALALQCPLPPFLNVTRDKKHQLFNFK